jgi:uncharacterized protein
VKLASNLSLPLDAVTQKLAFIGRTGSGKTYAATKLAELFGEAGAQFIALDPVGKWWSLRLRSDGKSAGFDVPVFGGLHGDLPLEPLMGVRIADLIVDRQISAVLDVSQFEHNTDKARFAEAFATRLFFRKKSAPSAVHLFVEEAQEFVPQNPQGEEKRMLGAFERLVKLGRNFGIGASLISQRPQEINKKALNQTECLFVFQTTGVHERKAIAAWIADKGIDEDIAALLPSLRVGEARVWSPSWLRVSTTTKINEKRTFDASATPKVGDQRVEVKALTPIDIAEITKSLADVVERAKADDPRELRRRIAELERQIRSAPAKSVEVPLLTKAQEKRLEELRDIVSGLRGCLPKMDQQLDAIIRLHHEFNRDVQDMAARVEKAVTSIGTVRPTAKVQTSAAPVPPRVARQPVQAGHEETNGDLPKGERAVLTAVAQQKSGAMRDQVSALTGYKQQTRDTYISRLITKGFVVMSERGGLLVVTADGMEALGPSFQPLPTGEALIDYWKNKLPKGERLIFTALVEAWPASVTREELTEKTGFVQQTRDTYISRLHRNKIIDKPQRGEPICASEALMAYAR